MITTPETPRDESANETAVRPPTIKKANGTCLATGAAIPVKYIRAEGQAGRIGAHLLAVVAKGSKGRVYLSPPGNGDHEPGLGNKAFNGPIEPSTETDGKEALAPKTYLADAPADIRGPARDDKDAVQAQYTSDTQGGSGTQSKKGGESSEISGLRADF